MMINLPTMGKIITVSIAVGIAIPGLCVAALKLPYATGTSFVVAQGYHTSPTHLGKDDYAIDFTEDGCEAYGKSALAAVSGTVIFASQAGYNGGYGTEALVEFASGTRIVRYAHLIPGSIVVVPGMKVLQGQRIGAIGNTGFVEGDTCVAHPGTHLHFAVYDILANGSYGARDPEPLSGYVGIVAGTWYRSDNAPSSSQNERISSAGGAVRGTSTAISPFPSSSSPAASSSSPSDRSPSSSVTSSIVSFAPPSLTSSSSSTDDADEEYCPE